MQTGGAEDGDGPPRMGATLKRSLGVLCPDGTADDEQEQEQEPRERERERERVESKEKEKE